MPAPQTTTPHGGDALACIPVVVACINVASDDVSDMPSPDLGGPLGSPPESLAPGAYVRDEELSSSQPLVYRARDGTAVILLEPNPPQRL
jgi:hypothetical protein